MADPAEQTRTSADRAVLRRRAAAAGALAAVIAAGLAVHGAMPDSAFADMAGDALYACALYLALVVLLPRQQPLMLGGIALAWCIAVELFQLTGIPLAWSAAVPAVKLVLGTGFDARDLVVYSAAVTASVAIDLLVRARVRVDPGPADHP